MNDFDKKALLWDNNPEHWDRSEAIASLLRKKLSLNKKMSALEFGAGTGILSFLLADSFGEITLIDNAPGMVQVMNEKIKAGNKHNLIPIFFDLEKSDYPEKKFDCIFSQMVFHHVSDIEKLSRKFFNMINKGSYLAIADLYKEDGSFHGLQAEVHKGFDPTEVKNMLYNIGFTDVSYQTCYTITRENGKEYPIFLMIAKK